VKRLTAERPESTEDSSPEGWRRVPLAEVVVPVPNARPGDEPDREFGYVDISSIDNSTFRITDAKRLKGRDAPSRARRPIKPGDVLFSNVRTYLRNIAVVPKAAGLHLCSTGFTVLRSNGSVDPTFLFRYVLTDDFLDRVTPQQTGTHYPATSDRVVMAEVIPVPPLAEQRRIVAKVEELLARVNPARERLARVPALLKRFRQAVLAAACEGRLTASDTATWTETTLGEASREITVGHVGPMADEYVDPGIPFLRSQNVREFRFDPKGLKFISKEFHLRLRKTMLRPGDIAVVRSGNSGVACVIPPELKEANCADLVVIRPSERLDSGFAAIFLNSSASRAHVEDVKVGIAQGHFNIGSAREMPIRLPALAEQREIGGRVDALFKLADAIETHVVAATARADTLTQAILAKAFRGELVPTEADLARRRR
jgi:type I restriction enzyme S subunit